MTDLIPDQAMQRAREFIYDAVDVPELDGEVTSEAGARVVAMAMAAERERCAARLDELVSQREAAGRRSGNGYLSSAAAIIRRLS